jgi:hypothetical protein
MEFNMLTFTKQDSILIAATLAIVLSVPLLVPAFYGTSTITLSDGVASPLPNGDRLGRLSERNDVGGDHGDARSRGPSLDCGLSSGFSI